MSSRNIIHASGFEVNLSQYWRDGIGPWFSKLMRNVSTQRVVWMAFSYRRPDGGSTARWCSQARASPDQRTKNSRKPRCQCQAIRCQPSRFRIVWSWPSISPRQETTRKSRRRKAGQLFSAVVRSYGKEPRRVRSKRSTRVGSPEPYISLLDRGD